MTGCRKPFLHCFLCLATTVLKNRFIVLSLSWALHGAPLANVPWTRNKAGPRAARITWSHPLLMRKTTCAVTRRYYKNGHFSKCARTWKKWGSASLEVGKHYLCKQVTILTGEGTRGTLLARSLEHGTLDLGGVESLSLTLAIEIKNKIFTNLSKLESKIWSNHIFISLS